MDTTNQIFQMADTNADCVKSDACLLTDGHDGDCITTETIGLFRRERLQGGEHPATYDTEVGAVRLAVLMDAVATKEARDIVTIHAPRAIDTFLQKNSNHVRTPLDLGERGLFPDIHRKMGVLRDRIWNDEESEGEPTTEIIQDIIGHLFLMLYMLDSEGNEEH
jgi:hypothetical protein